MSYERRIDRENPGCIILLVDQSGSMIDRIGGSPKTKSQALCDVVNSVLYELVLRCVKNPSEGPRHYYDVAVIGYGRAVGSLLSHLSESVLIGSDLLGRNPLRISEVVEPDGSATKRPEWITPAAEGGTPMRAAFDLAGQTAADWIRAHPASFPPIVINVTDGESTDGDPSELARRLMSLATQDGSLLLFNVSLSEFVNAGICFPSDPSELSDPAARALFEISSLLPGYMVSIANSAGFDLVQGARGFAFNADFAAVASFLRVGTSTAHVER